MNNGGKSFRLHKGFVELSDYHTSGKFERSGKTEAKTISLPGEVVLAGYFVVKVTTLRGGEGTGRGDGYIHEVKAQKLLVSYDIASVCNHRIA